MPNSDPLTPYVRIDQQKTLANIERFQRLCDRTGIDFRPHIKTHKQPLVGHWQIDAGAVGINCQKLSEAEVFARAGFDDLLITYNILGRERLNRLAALNRQCKLTVTADHAFVVDGLASIASQDAPLSVMVECNTGANRCGVPTSEQALELAKHILSKDGLRFSGLMTYPPAGKIEAVNQWLMDARALFDQAGIAVQVVSSGGAPDMWQLPRMKAITEYRCGTYVYNDRSLLERGICQLEECALTLEVTVVSTPEPGRVVMDAGSKALSSDLLGLEGFGHIVQYPMAHILSLSEEHGVVDVSRCPHSPAIGDRLSIIPNHACVVSNLYDHVWLAQLDGSLSRQDVVARGCVF
ncbi:MAG: alanine racemase [Saccharospirillum sp.]|nr:alanine racemase [Saccharospirillum sp.]